MKGHDGWLPLQISDTVQEYHLKKIKCIWLVKFYFCSVSTS